MKKIQKAYKHRLQLNPTQEQTLRQFAGSCRYVFNQMLAYSQKQYQNDNTHKFSYTELANLLPIWKKEVERAWLAGVPAQALQQAIKQLETAMKRFFNKTSSYPNFKKKSSTASFKIPQGFKIDENNHRIFVPKIGWLKYINSYQTKLSGTPKNITLSSKNNQWYVSIQTEQMVVPPQHPSTTIVGVDVGVSRFLTFSDGSFIEPLNALKKKQARLARYQRAMSRKILRSQNFKKAKQKVSRLHEKISNTRKDFLHKVSNNLSKNHAVIVLEDLKITNMSRSAHGTVEKHGRNVKAKSGLNKSILDQSWGELKRQLIYKQDWRGGQVLLVPPQYTSQRCSECNHVDKKSRISQSQFKCIACGFKHNADVNAAKNILAAGHAVLGGVKPVQKTCGEKMWLGLSVKQEPAENNTLKNVLLVGNPVL